MQTKHKTQYTTTVKAPISKVWDALTNPKIVVRYFFGSNLVTDWQVGNPIYFRGEYEGKPYEDKGTVLAYETEQNLTFSYLSSWSGLPDEPDNYLEVSYAVKPMNEGTALTITQSNYDEERAKHSEGNWKMVIDGMKKIVE